VSQDPFIICENLVKIYKIADLEVVALKGFDLIVESGELLGVVGASGSGKTSLLNILGGLDRPSAGRVWVGGYDLLKMSDAALNRYRLTEVGFIWQQGARNLVPYLSALENVQLPLTLGGETGGKKRRRAEELLEAVGLGERRHYYLAQMSGGEQQRVAIAVALANNPKLLLADEPTGEVDSTTALTIYQTFKDLNRAYGLTTLIISHDPNLAHHVNRVVSIRDGQLSSETVRQASGTISVNGQEVTEEGKAPEQVVFEELVVLDSSGRLQVPKEYLAQLNIKGRAQLELVEGGILIKPVAQAEQRERAPEGERAEAAVAKFKLASKGSGLSRLWGRLRLRKNQTPQEEV
jgi:ABC-type lipoprotein export system ATPase subunit